MRWFKHMTAARRDEKLVRLQDEFGVEGYGIYIMILEIIAEQMDGDSEKCSVAFSERFWRKEIGILPKKLKNFVTFSKKIGIFSVKTEGDQIDISCPNLLKYRDEYATKRARENAEKSGQTPDNVRSDSDHSASASSQEGKPMEDEGGNPFDEAVKTAEAGR